MTSPADQAVSAVASGHPVIVVKAPPGGGKSTLIATVCARLAREYGLSMTIGTPTREQACNIAIKLLDVLPAGHVRLSVSGIQPLSLDDRWAFITYDSDIGTVTIRTLDSLRMERDPEPSRLLVVDEAFQAPFVLGASAARARSQILAVGDPGQIGPVITIDPSIFDDLPLAPHRPFAHALSYLPDVHTITMNVTYRLGQRTADLLTHLYDFPFTSARPPAQVVGFNELESVVSDNVVEAAIARVHGILGSTYEHDGAFRAVTQRDVAVITSLRIHTAEVSARLRSANLPHVQVGTADQLQGGQWPAVIAIDPLAAETISDHHLSLGRLCVMLSRHIAHCTFVTTPTWADGLDRVEGDHRLHRDIRASLLDPS